MTTAAEIRDAWQRIDAWFAAHAEPNLDALAPPADPQIIRAAEAELGLALPDEWKASLTVHDGQDAGENEVFSDWAVYGVEDAMAAWRSFGEMADDGTLDTADSPEISADPSVHPRAWDRAWIPIAADGTGEYLLLDLAPRTAKNRGQIISYGPRTSKRLVVAADYGAWIVAMARELDAGRWRFDEDAQVIVRV